MARDATIDKEQVRKRTATIDAFLKLTVELAFIVLPLIVLAYVMLSRNGLGSLVKSPEWSFASCVLFGQAIAKLAHGSMKNPGTIRPMFVNIGIVGVLVLGVIPSVLVLADILSRESTAPQIQSPPHDVHPKDADPDGRNLSASQDSPNVGPADETAGNIAFWAQGVLFLVALGVYYWIGGIGEHKIAILEESLTHQQCKLAADIDQGG